MGALPRFATCLVALLVSSGLAVPAAADDAAAVAPALTTTPTSVHRGSWARISALDLRPDTVYSLAATAGTLRSLDQRQQLAETTTDSAGAFSVRLSVDSSIPASVTWSRVTATDPDGVTHAVGVVVTKPVLGASSQVCPVRTLQTFSLGFTDGKYEVTGDGLAEPVVTTASGGSFSFAPRLGAEVPENVTLHVRSQTDEAAAYDFSFARSPVESGEYAHVAYYPWHRSAWLSCLRPNDTVTFTSRSAQLPAPHPVEVDAEGGVSVALIPRPAPRPTVVPGVVWRTVGTGQTGITAAVPMWGTTLLRGDVVAAGRNGLVSPRGRYTLGFSACTLELAQGIGTGYTYRTWIPVRSSLRRDDCTAALTSTGDFVIRDHSGRVMWSAGTGGTGSANRLTLRDDGNLVMYTATKRVVWTSNTGIVRTASTLGSGQSLTRGQSLVQGSTRLKLRASGNLVVERGRATLWQSRTAKRGVTRLQLTRTGLVVLRNATGRVVWSNRGLQTGIEPHLTVRTDGDVVVTGAPREVLWHTRTARHR